MIIVLLLLIVLRWFLLYNIQFIRTATAEGQIMAQVMSTFSRLEQSRFEAFRRATFPRDAIAKYVAHCLIEEQHRPISRGVLPGNTIQSHVGPDGDNNPQPNSRHRHREPVLSEVVAPGQAEDIALIVSILAKAYAQRLVTAARRHAAIRCTTVGEVTKNDNNNNTEYTRGSTMATTTTSASTLATTSTNASGAPSTVLEGGKTGNPNVDHSPRSAL
jgi:hypothetical protein